MHIAEFSVKNSVLVNLLMGAIFIIGLVFALVLPLELFPSIKLELVTVKTVFPGASAEDIEKLVTIPIEEEIKTTSGINVLRSISSEGLSVVIAELDTGEDVTKFVNDIDSKVSRIKDKLPEDADDPVIEEVQSDFPLINIAITGEVPRETLRQNALRLRDELQLIDGVDNIVFSGLGDPIYWVNLDYPKMHQYKVSIDQVSGAIAKRNLDLPGGGYTQDNTELLVRTRGKIYEISDILNIPIITDTSGKNVLIRDIATVEIGEEKTRTSARVNGEPAITFWINKQKNIDAIETVGVIREFIEEFKTTLPESINIYDTNDSSYWVKKRFQSMLKSGGLGLFFVVIMLGLFLNRRAAFIAALGIPISFLGAFILMKMSGITINMLSMFGLIMVLGIVVDDAIIVVENVQRYIAQGMAPREAAIKGTKEVALPVFATVLTNIAAFIPLLFATSLIGQFLSIIPKVAIFALLVSLVEALLIMPSHCADWMKPRDKKTVTKAKWFYKVRSYYIKGLSFSLRNRYVVVSSFFLILFFSFFIIKGLPNVMFYQHDTSEFQIKVENPAQSSLEYTKNSVKEIEKIVMQVVPESALKNIVSMIGIDLTTNDSPTIGDHIATIIVEFEDFEDREENGLELKNQVRDEVLRVIVGPEKLDFIAEAGIPTGKPIDIRILGNNLDTLKEISLQVQEELSQYKGVYGVSDNLVWGKPEIRVTVDEQKAAIFGLDTTSVAREVRALVDGLTVAQTRIGKEEADIKIRYDLQSENLLNLLQSHQVITPTKERVSLGTIATIEMRPSILNIKRYESNRSISITAEVDQKITTSNEVNTIITGFLDNILTRYPTYNYKLAGEEEDYRKTMDDIMRASIAAIILIYLILASILRSYFQPLIIMTILPFTLIGVTAGILLRGEPRTLPAIIGIVALLGIVVNDSLLLMDFINKRRDRFNNRVFAVVMSAKHRFRPIILTTLTTFAGLSTLMFEFRGEASFLAPMATALGVGLLFSTILLLFLIPCLYLILDDIQSIIKWKLGMENDK